MLRKHRVLFVTDPNAANDQLDIYRYLLNGKKDYVTFSCSNDLSKLCLEIVDKEPDTIIFSTDNFKTVDELELFISTIRGVSENIIFINFYSSDDYGIMDYIDNVVFIYSISMFSSIKYALSYIDILGKKLRCNSMDFENDLNEYVFDLVKTFNCSSHRNGFVYITQSIIYLLMNDTKYITFNKDIYPYLMRKYGASLESIDNAMRRFVNAAWGKLDDSVKEIYFKDYVRRNSKPTSQEFVYEIADHIYVNNRREICNYYLKRSY